MTYLLTRCSAPFGVGSLSILIKKAGACSDYANTAVALAKAMNLKCATTGGNGHEYFFIWVDGQKYYGSNNGLDLSKPSEYDPYITPFID